MISDFYSNKYEDHLGDFVCCLSVFEDIPAPLEFLKSLRRSIADRDVPVYFEVFNGYRAISDGEVWSVHYEQCNYFSLDALTNIFELAGFEIIESGSCYEGDQYLYVEARPATAGSKVLGPRLPSKFSETVSRFSDMFKERVDWWGKKLDECRRDRRRVVSWGSGGKGITFLTSVPNADVVQEVVDINPERQRYFIPLSGQPIVDPGELVRSVPDVVILTNGLYQREISECLTELEIACEIIVA